MFQFDDADRIRFPERDGGGPTSMFERFRWNPSWTWYLVNARSGTTTFDIEQMFFGVAEASQLKEMLEQQSEASYIESVQVVLQPEITKTGLWQMEQLHEIWIPKSSKPGNFSELWVTSGGEFRASLTNPAADHYLYVDCVNDCWGKVENWNRTR